MKRVLILGMVLWVGACSGEGSAVFVTDLGLASDVSGPDVHQRPEQDNVSSPDTAADVLAVDALDLAFDLGVDVAFESCEGSGCFGDPCSENSECQSGFCVDHLGGGVCSQSCQTECPPGWSCQQVGTGPDLAYFCISAMANLCRPCADANDCKSPGGAEDVCVDYGSDGNFCGGKCAVDDDCPWGFSCVEAVTVGGVEVKQCVADAGECPCADASVELGLATPCRIENEFGSCFGQRVCTDAGLSDCDAAVAGPEICNGLDDDCDGDIDEPDLVDGDFVNLCNDDNPCTKDVCSGSEGCLNEVLEEGDCSDGDACTVADHCAAGVCTGEPVLCDDKNPCTENLCTVTGGCEFPDVAGECDDDDPCTLGDHCVAGTCTGQAVACDCLEDADCDPLEDGDICNGQLYCDVSQVPYQCRVKSGTEVACPAPSGVDAPCLAASCNPETGVCSFVPANDGMACNDGDNCTFGEVCQQGQCGGGSAVNCNDGNPCTNDSCDSQSGCLQTPNVSPCSDGNVCTTGDVCADGECAGGVTLACNDDNPCTDDSCSPEVGCVFSANQGQCDDGDSCTLDDHCSQGKCVASQEKSCNDDNPCTNDSCDPIQGCLHLLNQAPCDDKDVCTYGDHCNLGECVGGGQLACNDGNLCTDDACDPKVGCAFTPNNAACDDENACTTQDACAEGWCKGGGKLDCDDDNPCTNDACDPQVGCIHFDNGLFCDDGDACTAGEQCVTGECVGGQPVNCSDDNLCTDDSCAPDLGCLHVANALPCNDGNACTTNDTCAESSCQGGPAPDCDDENVCTDDSCLPQSGCTNTPLSGTPCSDDTVCTVDDVCVDGACVSGAPLDCVDADYCTNDSCDPVLGCVNETFTPCCGNGDLEAGEGCDDGNQVDGDGCSAVCQLDGKLVPGNTTKIVSRNGFKIQCKKWSGDTCQQIWFSVPDNAVTNKANCGIDDLTTLRPVWHGTVTEQCKQLCWIATGDSTCVATDTNGGSASHSGWMYGSLSYAIGCDADGRQNSEVSVPTVGKLIWSFDKFSWSRSGNFSTYRCNW